ncbi:WhiB family transcriptional regulator [Actinopolymorpha sp. NPDC004070]|uniref:WhiB family transcriptional regulator n=1 Tax=Actinopolymorpha sp. NPDC004070 TaxID=3154548 RepID=UPI0033A864FA
MSRIDVHELRRTARLTDSQLREITHHRGLCSRNADRADEWFLPEPNPGSTKARDAYERRAEELCCGCPVRVECLEFALRRETGHAAWGVWGGLAPWRREELVQIRRDADRDDEVVTRTARALSGVG